MKRPVAVIALLAFAAVGAWSVLRNRPERDAGEPLKSKLEATRVNVHAIRDAVRGHDRDLISDAISG